MACRALLMAALPKGAASVRISRRVAGVGSLGRPRFVAIAESAGGLVAREAKAWAPSAATRLRASAGGDVASRLLPRVVRAVDPGFAIRRPWIIRRLAPDCSKIEVDDLPGNGTNRSCCVRWVGRRRTCMATPAHAGLRSRETVLAPTAGSGGHDAMAATIEDWRLWKRQGRST
jgi:hypothetical protein